MNRFTIISAILGVVLIAWGCAWIYRPLGPLVCGGIFMFAAFSSARKK